MTTPLASPCWHVDPLVRWIFRHLDITDHDWNLRKAFITNFLVFGKWFTSQRSGLVNWNINRICEMAVGGNNIAILKEIMSPGTKWNVSISIQFAVTFDFSLGRKGIHECFDGITSITFFVKNQYLSSSWWTEGSLYWSSNISFLSSPTKYQNNWLPRAFSA